ncbi:MAG: hypothetical protein ACYTEQ_31350 [Planctomycetota bacterium]|jgi:hypothetical protein
MTERQDQQAAEYIASRIRIVGHEDPRTSIHGVLKCIDNQDCPHYTGEWCCEDGLCNGCEHDPG